MKEIGNPESKGKINNNYILKVEWKKLPRDWLRLNNDEIREVSACN